MSFTLKIHPSHILETAEEFSVNISAGLFLTAFVAHDPFVLTTNIVGVIMFIIIAVVLKARIDLKS